MQAMLGHDGPPTNFWRENLLTDEPLTECPLRTLLRAADDPLAREVARMADEYFPAYPTTLLVGGGLSQQPARYLAYMNTLRDLENASQAKYDAVTAPTPPSGEGEG